MFLSCEGESHDLKEWFPFLDSTFKPLLPCLVEQAANDLSDLV